MNAPLQSSRAGRKRRRNGIARPSIGSSDAETMVLVGKFTVHPQFFETIESRVTDILPFLLEGVTYSPVELIGEDLWRDITSLGQRQATFCLMHMATMPGAALREVGPSGSELTMFEVRPTGVVDTFAAQTHSSGK